MKVTEMSLEQLEAIVTGPMHGPRISLVMERVPLDGPLDEDGWPEFEEQPMKVGCFECGGFDGVTAPDRLVIGTGVASASFDPTTSYKLVCGHWAI
jgi:hypothetical protein